MSISSFDIGLLPFAWVKTPLLCKRRGSPTRGPAIRNLIIFKSRGLLLAGCARIFLLCRYPKPWCTGQRPRVVRQALSLAIPQTLGASKVRFGSTSDIPADQRDVCFAPDSRHLRSHSSPSAHIRKASDACPLHAKFAEGLQEFQDKFAKGRAHFVFELYKFKQRSNICEERASWCSSATRPQAIAFQVPPTDGSMLPCPNRSPS